MKLTTVIMKSFLDHEPMPGIQFHFILFTKTVFASLKPSTLIVTLEIMPVPPIILLDLFEFLLFCSYCCQFYSC
jgi:hypothetical protein